MSHPAPALRPNPALHSDSPNPRGAAYPAWLRPALRDASRMDLPYDPVFLDSSLSGTTLLTVLSHLGADVELRNVAIGWHACSKGRSATHELAPALRRADPDCEVDDFEGVFRFTLDGRPWVGGRIAVEGRHKPFLKTILGGPSLAALPRCQSRWPG